MTALYRRAKTWTPCIAALLLFGAAHPSTAYATTARQIDSRVDQVLAQFYKKIKGSRELVKKAEGVLIFPDVVKAGFGIGGEYGDGALRIAGRTAGYYNTVGLSVGFQLGAQRRSVIIAFMNKNALEKFRHSEGWKIGVDGSVTLAKLGAGADIDTNTITDPIVGFVFGNEGLMYNLTLEGAKISKLKL